jgi:hypothetical protein
MCGNRSHSGNVLSKNKLTHDSCKYLKPFETLISGFVQVNLDRTLNAIQKKKVFARAFNVGLSKNF